MVLDKFIKQLEQAGYSDTNNAIAVSIFSKSSDTKSMTFGNIKSNDDKGVDARTLFPICSLTKAVTATFIN